MNHNLNGRFANGNTLGRRYAPGHSGNPAGRPRRGGRSVREWINALQDHTAPQLRRIAGNDKLPANQRAAATQWLAAIKPLPDIADYEGLLTGKETLDDLKTRGVDTQAIRAFRSRTTPSGGHVAVIELRDPHCFARSLDRILERTP